MLPFGRMLSYGNIAPSKNTIELYATSNCYFLFDTLTNKLYGMGSSGSQLGLGGINVYNDFIHVASNVKRVITNIPGGSPLFIYQGLDDRLYATGISSAMENGGTPSAYATWTDITTIFSQTVNVNDIKYVQAYYSVKTNVVMNDGTLYCMGRNMPTGTEASGCFGNNTSSGSAKLLVKIPIDNVEYAYGNMYLQSNGDLYCCGVNNKYQYGRGSTTSSASVVKVASSVRYISGSYQCNYYISSTADLYVCGTQFRSDFGNELGTNTTTVCSTWTLLESNVRYVTSGIGNMSLHYITGNNVIKSTGYNVYGWFGIGTDAHTYIPTVPNPVPSITNDSILVRANNSAIILSGNKLFFAGRDFNSVNSLTFKEIAFPF